MHTIDDENVTKTRRPERSLPVFAGAAVGVAGGGAVLALTDLGSPLRAPFTLFFLIAAPAWAVGSALRGLDPLSRSVAGLGGAIALDLLVAQTMLALHQWTVRGGVAVVAAVSILLVLLSRLPRLSRLLLPARVRRQRGRALRGRAS